MLHIIFVNFALIYYYFVVLLDYFSLHFLCACESVLISRSSDVKSVDHFCNLILHLLSKARRFVNSLFMFHRWKKVVSVLNDTTMSKIQLKMRCLFVAEGER